MSGGKRYESSPAGLVGAMIVTLAVVIGFVAFRGLNRDNPAYRPEAHDYLKSAGAYAENRDLAYPSRLPDGWIATQDGKVDATGAWVLDLLTDQQRYVGLREAVLEPRLMVATYADTKSGLETDATLTGPVTIEGPVRNWQLWQVPGGDDILIGEAGEEHVMLFGSPGLDRLKELARLLVVR